MPSRFSQETGGERVLVHEQDVGALALLQFLVLRQDVRRFRTAEIEVAALVQVDGGRSPSTARCSPIARMNAMPKSEIRMFTVLENCWRIEAAESADAEKA